MSRYKLLGIAGVLVLILITAGNHIHPTHFQPASPANHISQPPAGPRYWIITSTALDEVTSNSKTLATLKNDTIYSPDYDPGAATPAERSLHVIPAKTYQSEARFEADVADGKIPTYVKAILYDNEPWQLTPGTEQQDPVTYYKQAYSLAHAHGYTMIAAPVPNTLAPVVAPYADIVDVQAQYAQSSTSAYLAAVTSTIDQARQANPHAIILSGLSTNPTAGDPSPQQLDGIAKATFSRLTRGWWLNIPNPGTACPRCHQARPDTAIKFLELLGATQQIAQ